jgi:hypothetical protein
LNPLSPRQWGEGQGEGLIFVLPLKISFGAGFSYLSNGWLPSLTEVGTVEHLRQVFIAYGGAATNRRACCPDEMKGFDSGQHANGRKRRTPASWSSISREPKSRHLPEKMSCAGFTDRTRPYAQNIPGDSFSVISGGRRRRKASVRTTPASMRAARQAFTDTRHAVVALFFQGCRSSDSNSTLGR